MTLPDLNFTEANFKQSDAALVKRIIKEGKTDSKEQAEIWVKKARATHDLEKALEAKKKAKALEKAAKLAQEKLDKDRAESIAELRRSIVGEIVLEEAKQSERMRGFLADRLKDKKSLFPELFEASKQPE